MKSQILAIALLSVLSGSISAGDQSSLLIQCANPKSVDVDGCKLRLTAALLRARHHKGSSEDKLKLLKEKSGLEGACIKKMKFWHSGEMSVLHLPTNEKGVTCRTFTCNGVDFVLSGLGNFSDITNFVEQCAAGVIALMLATSKK